jgi:hypothetical protein
MANIAPLTPVTVGQGSSLTPEEYESVILTPLRATSAIMSLENVAVHQSDVPLHLPIMLESALDDTAWVLPNSPVVEFDPTTSEVVLLARSLKSLKVLVKLSRESATTSMGLGAAQETITNQLVKAADKALLQGSVAAGIVGLLPSAGTTLVHSRKVTDAVTATNTALTSATAAFTSADVGSVVAGAGITPGTTIASVTNGTTVVLSAVTTATASGVTATITVPETVLDSLVDGLSIAENAYASPTAWLMAPPTIATLRKQKSTTGIPLLVPNLATAGGDVLLGRVVIPAPQMPVGSALLVDPRSIAIGFGMAGYARILLETFAASDQYGLLVVTHLDIACTLPAGLVAVTGIV